MPRDNLLYLAEIVEAIDRISAGSLESTRTVSVGVRCVAIMTMVSIGEIKAAKTSGRTSTNSTNKRLPTSDNEKSDGLKIARRMARM